VWQSKGLRYLIFCFFVASLAVGSHAQQQGVPSKEPARTPPQVASVLPSYEGQNVSTVEIAGRPDINVEELKSFLAQKEGEPFSQAKIDASIAALKKTGRFQAVQLQVFPDLQGLRVLLVLQPGLYFGMYRFPGATRFSYSRLLQVSNYPPEGPYSINDVNNAAAALKKYFQRTGFFLAEIEPEIQSDPDHGLVNVSFHTTLGKRAKFGEVDIQGPTPEMTELLRGKLKSLMARFKGAAIRPGKKYSSRTIQNATRRLENTLLSEDRLSAKVKLVGANYDPSTNRADVIFHVTPGPEINVKVEGAHLWSWTRRKLLPIYQQIGSDPEVILEGRRNLISHFQSKGYFNVDVKVDTEKHDHAQTIVYRIIKGPRHKVDEVKVAGNQSFSDKELLPSVAVKEGRFLSHGKFSEKLVSTSVKNLKAVYQSAGFSSVEVAPQVANKGGDIDVTFNVREGPRDIVAQLNIIGAKTLPIPKQKLKLAAGKPYSQKLADEDRTTIMSRYLGEGYLTATFRQTVKPISKDAHELVVTYNIYEGPRVIANSVITVGKKDTKQSFINRVAKLSPGKPLTVTDMLSSESRLYEPGIFDWAEVDPRRQITTQSKEDVVVKVHEARPNSITYGVGFEVVNRGGSIPSGTVAVPGLPPVGLSESFRVTEKTFWGPRGTIEYTRRNLRGRAESLTLAGRAGRLNQRLTINYRDPAFRESSWTSNLSVSGEHDSTNPLFSSRFAEAGVQFQKPLDKDNAKNVFLRYNYRQTGLSNLLLEGLIPPEDQHVRLSSLTASFLRDTRDKPLDATKGIYESFEIGITPKALGSSQTFSRLIAQTSHYTRLPKSIIWANNLRLGFLKAFGASHVPVSEQFFTGGGSTLRGFPLNGAGPQKTISVCDGSGNCFPTTVAAGGNQLLIFNSEFRIPVPIKKGLGVVAFYDGGNVFRTIGFHGQYTNTLGFGIRYATPVGPVRVDIGHNLNAPPGIKSTQYFITLGQAF
jgi:outer membrane protein insertion porin family